MRVWVCSIGGKSRPTRTPSARHASRNWRAGCPRPTKIWLVCESVASYPKSLNAWSVKSRMRAFSARSSSMCPGSLSDAIPATADSVLTLPRFQARAIASTVSGCPTA